MSDKQINIAIAEACGWKFEQTEEGGKITYPSGFACEFYPISWAEEKFLKTIPNYCSDLNAMHEAENRLTSFQRAKHGKILQDLLNEHAVGFVPSYDRDFASLSRIASATARQRAEAFLRTIGKWEGAK